MCCVARLVAVVFLILDIQSQGARLPHPAAYRYRFPTTRLPPGPQKRNLFLVCLTIVKFTYVLEIFKCQKPVNKGLSGHQFGHGG